MEVFFNASICGLGESATGLGCAKTKSDLVVMSSGRQIFAFSCSPHDPFLESGHCRRARKDRHGLVASRNAIRPLRLHGMPALHLTRRRRPCSPFPIATSSWWIAPLFHS
jgi:hypothetical protein